MPPAESYPSRERNDCPTEEQYKPFEDGVVPGPLRLEMPIIADIFGTEIRSPPQS